MPGLGGGAIQWIGWDFGQVAQASPTDYVFTDSLPAGATLTATLDWFIDNTYFPATLSAADGSLDDLDLEVWKTTAAGVPDTLIARSISEYNNVEHLSFLLPETANYMIRVKWSREVFDLVGDANQEVYGLSWSAGTVPEPNACALVMAGALLVIGRRRRVAVGRRLSTATARYASSFPVAKTGWQDGR